jgi:AraC-like DNA-binding protein
MARQSPLIGSLGMAAFAELFDGLPHLMACAKQPNGKYLYANHAFVERAGCKRPAQVVGKTAADLFPVDLAALYEKQDELVLRSGKPLQDHLELIWNGTGQHRWCVTSKVRLLSDAGEVVGIFCVSVDTPAPELTAGGLLNALTHMRANIQHTLRVGELAAVANMTQAQFDRQIRKTFGMAPRQLLQQLRFDEAMHRLSHSDEPIAEVADSCGFFDQASFTKQFRAATGVTPGAYRSGQPFRHR